MPPMPPMGPGGRKPGGPHGARLTMEKPKDAKNTLKKLIGYIGRNRYLFFALIGVMLIITLLNLAAPSIQQIAIDCITLTKKKTSVDFSALGKTLIGLGAVYLLSSVFTYMQGIFSAKLSQYTVKTMRKDLFSSLVRLPIKYLDTHSHGDIMSRMTNDVENISTTISQSIGSLISGVLTIVGTVVIMLLYSPLLTLISLSNLSQKPFCGFQRRFGYIHRTCLRKLLSCAVAVKHTDTIYTKSFCTKHVMLPVACHYHL